MELTQEHKLYQEIVQKAWEDEAFKSQLVADPVAAIEQMTGRKLELPEGKTLVVRDQTAENTVYINIPASAEVDAELNEEQLEAVSGGVHGPNGCFPTINEFEDLLKTIFAPTGPTVPNVE